MPLEQEHFFTCPYCAISNSITLDFTGGSNQKFVTDCETCCSPILIRLSFDETELVSFDAVKENE